MKRPYLALTSGDVCGIGPEILVRAFASGKIFRFCKPIVIGQAPPLEYAIRLVGADIDINRIGGISEASCRRGKIDLIEIKDVTLRDIKWGRINMAASRLAIRSIETAVSMALQGYIDGIVTLPVNKKGLEKAGLPFPGHTEFLASLTRTKDFAMLLMGGRIRVVLVTRHIPLEDVSGSIKKKEVFKDIILADAACRDLGIKSPRIGVSALNPHAGEEGLLGMEEKREILPAIKSARRMGIEVSGPYPADSLFYYVNRGRFDIVVAMYHDQGLIPLKMLSFEGSVNVTLGLPIVRTSPGHGTAYDIAGKGIASEKAFLEAVKIAAILARNKCVRS